MPATLVTMAGPPRTMRVLPRGNWLDDSGEVVAPGTPAFAAAADASRAAAADAARPGELAGRAGQPADGPRVRQPAVEAVLRPGPGRSRSTTSARRASWPTHPELLDWLAVEFLDSGWDVKHLVRLMVTSSDLPAVVGRRRRAARARPVQRAARAAGALPPRRRAGPRQRPGGQRPARPQGRRAERQAVPAGRLLGVPQLPDARAGSHGHGREDQYRRGLYTYWQRTFLHPSMLGASTPRAARSAPSSGRARTRRSRRWCC